MTWIAWRVQRPQYIALGAAVLALVAWLLASAASGTSSWAQSSSGADLYVMTALPGVLGLAFGCPLVASELEQKTNRLAWTQGIGRTNWFGKKVLIVGVVVCALAGLLVPLLDWWSGAVGDGPDVVPKMFDVTGIVLVGYTMFAYGLGVFLGTIIRRAGWAFAAGVPIFAAVRLLVGGVRSTLVAPSTKVLASEGSPPSGWLLHGAFLPLGRTTPTSGQSWLGTWGHISKGLSACLNSANSDTSAARCAAASHVHYVWQYQPQSHYWALQGTETAVFFGATAVCLGLATLAVRHVNG
jgi:ABC-type transport system involved in multi-copper enzyme maturation permease subunit